MHFDRMHYPPLLPRIVSDKIRWKATWRFTWKPCSNPGTIGWLTVVGLGRSARGANLNGV